MLSTESQKGSTLFLSFFFLVGGWNSLSWLLLLPGVLLFSFSNRALGLVRQKPVNLERISKWVSEFWILETRLRKGGVFFDALELLAVG